MKITLVRAPTTSFLEMILNNIRASEHKRLEGSQWGAVGLVQAKLIDFIGLPI